MIIINSLSETEYLNVHIIWIYRLEFCFVRKKRIKLIARWRQIQISMVPGS